MIMNNSCSFVSFAWLINMSFSILFFVYNGLFSIFAFVNNSFISVFAFMDNCLFSTFTFMDNCFSVFSFMNFFLLSSYIVNCKNKKLKFTLVSPSEANPLDGKISNESPLGKAFLGKRKSQTAEALTPQGKKKFEIISIA